MANFATIVSDAVHILSNNPEQALIIEGAPGGGKTAACHEIAKQLGIPAEAVITITPPVMDAPDVMGLIDLSADHTICKPAKYLYDCNKAAKEYGRAALIIDEIGQGSTPVQNSLGGLLYGNAVGGVTLDRNVVKVCTTNRTQDKAGVTRMPTQIANRLVHMQMESHLDGWVDWALGAGVPIWLISFLRFKPQLLNDFDPNRKVNPTERTWELLARATSDTTPDDTFFRVSTGMVGEGAAAELSAFRNVMNKLPSVDTILMSPGDHPVPKDEPAVMYALMGALANVATKDNFGRMTEFLLRCPAEFQVISIKDAMRIQPDVKQTQAFVNWALKNKNIFM